MQIVDDRAVGEHRFEAHDKLAGHAIADHAIAAGVGRQIAADGATAAGAEVERKQQALGVGLFLDGLQGYAGFDGHGAGVRVEFDHLVHPFEAQADLVLERRGAGDEAGHAALGRNRLARGVAQGQNRRNFLGRRGAQQQGRADGPILHQILEILRFDIAAFAIAGGPDDLLEPFEQVRAGGNCLRGHDRVRFNTGTRMVAH